MTTSTITRKGQVTIPKPVRDELDLHEGDRLSFLVRGDELVARAVRGTVLDLRGSVTPRQRPEDFDEVRREVRQRLIERRHGKK